MSTAHDSEPTPAAHEFDTATTESGTPEASGRSRTLEERQAELVRALVIGGEVPTGFDRADVTAAAHGLLHKRAEEVAHRFPRLAHAAGPDFRARYVEWAARRPKSTTAADAAAFARELGLPEPPPAPGRWARLRDRLR